MLEEVISYFAIDGEMTECKPWGNGHINDTYLITCHTPNQGEMRYILQKINKSVFKNPADVMENIVGVTSYLRKKIVERGGNPERETLKVIQTKDGSSFWIDENGEYWRIVKFIEHAICLEKIENPQEFYEIAFAFGKFQYLLADYPVENLHETIPGFHDTKARFKVFKNAVAEDRCARASSAKKEIDFVLKREDVVLALGDVLSKGEFPLRVTHNDTKLNNIMLDDETGKAICVIDLDTVMPGFAVNDFGDSIRSGACVVKKGETGLDEVQCDMELFEIYTKGFIEGCAGQLTAREIEMLPMGAKIMAFECGMRYLTDYLEGDIYFKVNKENQNLEKCRKQFKLLADMEKKSDAMNQIVRKYMK